MIFGRENSAHQVWPWLALAAFLFCFLSPLKTQNIDARGIAPVGLKIRPPQGSPAYSAFEDLQIDLSGGANSAAGAGAPSATEKVPLAAGVKFSWQISPVMALAPRPQLALTHTKIDLSKIPLGGRLVAKVAAPQRLQGLRIQQPVTPVVAKMEDVRFPTAALPAPAAPTLQDKMRELVAKELAAREREGDSQKVHQSQFATPIFIAKGESPGNPPQMSPNRSDQVAPKGAPGPAAGPRARGTNGLTQADPEGADSHEPSPGRRLIAGNFELGGGLAYTASGERIEIFREEGGQRQEIAKVNLPEGKFSLGEITPKGRLVAKLWRENRVQGIAEMQLEGADLADQEEQNLLLKLQPVTQGLRLSAVSAYSHRGYIEKVRGARATLGDGSELEAAEPGHMFVAENLSRGSSVIAQVDAPNHWGTTVIGAVGTDVQARLFAQPMMEAFLSLTGGANRDMAKSFGIIWGRVTSHGKPLAGAKVELAGVQRAGAIYFNPLLLPDRFAEGTGENGFFAFVWVNPGLQQVRVRIQDRIIPAQIAVAEVGRISYVEFDIGDQEGVPLKIVDPLDPHREIYATLRPAGDDDQPMDVQGRGTLNLVRGSGVMMLELDAGEAYELVRTTINHNARIVEIPVVRRDHLSQLIARRHINVTPGQGIVMGWVDHDDFTVSMVSERKSQDSEPPIDIVYFDRLGHPIFGDEGVRGGGFALFNVPPGLKTLKLSTRTGETHTRVIVVDPDFVSAFKFQGEN